MTDRRLRFSTMFLAAGGSLPVMLLPGCPASLEYQLVHDGLTRGYHLYVPAGYDPATPLPLVIVLHGGGGTGMRMERWLGFDALADSEGFLVAYPDATDHQWNDGRVASAGGHTPPNADDVGFLAAMIEAIAGKFMVDLDRVYMTGASNGAMMTYRFACERGERLAAIAPVIGGVPAAIAEGCAPPPLPALIISGDADPLVPFEGGPVQVGRQNRGEVLGARESAARLAAANGCDAPPVETPLPERDPDDGTSVTMAAYAGCADGSEVLLYIVEGGGHTWPGTELPRLPGNGIGRTSQELDATALIWAFFAAHAR